MSGSLAEVHLSLMNTYVQKLKFEELYAWITATLRMCNRLFFLPNGVLLVQRASEHLHSTIASIPTCISSSQQDPTGMLGLPFQAHCFTSSGVGPAGSSEAARLHWWNARTWSGLKAPTTVCRTPRLWNSTRSFSRL